MAQRELRPPKERGAGRASAGPRLTNHAPSGDHACNMGKSIKKMKFEEAMRRLDEIVESIESGEIGLEDSIAGHEEATRLATHCRTILDAAEQRVRRVRVNSEGNASTAPFRPGGAPADTTDADSPGTE